MITNPHRGSDFTKFLIEEEIQPMTPTPRTDALRLKMAQLGWPSDFEPVAMLMASQDEMERELAAEREQIAILRSDEKRLAKFTKTYRLRAEEAEDKLADSRAWSSKLADVADDLRAELAAERALADRLGEALENATSWDYAKPTLDTWKEARRGTD